MTAFRSVAGRHRHHIKGTRSSASNAQQHSAALKCAENSAREVQTYEGIPERDKSSFLSIDDHRFRGRFRFGLFSAMQPLTSTLDSMVAELQAAAWYNKYAA